MHYMIADEDLIYRSCWFDRPAVVNSNAADRTMVADTEVRIQK